MSFSSDVKQEISQQEFSGGAAKALLCALFLSRASLNWNRGNTWLSFQTQNASIAKLVFRLLKSEYQADVQIASIRRMNLKKNNEYRLTITSRAEEILESLGILRPNGLYNVPPYPMVRSERNARAFIQGLFLAAGSINHPKTTNYHMEMTLPSQELAALAVKLMERFYIPSKITLRKQSFVVYTKVGDKIADFLRLLGASQSLFNFEDQRIQRDFYNQLTRLDNCEVANEMKTMKAASEQLAWIAAIEEAKIKVPDKIAHVMEARKKNPDASILELCDAVYVLYGETISKSGMKHRMAKIRELAKVHLEDAEQPEEPESQTKQPLERASSKPKTKNETKEKEEKE